jgi:hypothetical protein
MFLKEWFDLHLIPRQEVTAKTHTKVTAYQSLSLIVLFVV